MSKSEADVRNTLEELAAGCCPGCARRLGRRDINGGRCNRCGRMLCAVVLADLPLFEVVGTPLRVRAETAAQVVAAGRQLLRGRPQVVQVEGA